MNKEQDITLKIYLELADKVLYKKRGFNNYLARSVFEAIDKERITYIKLKDGIFHFETQYSAKGLTGEEFDWLSNFLIKKGYRSLYNLEGVN